MPRADRIHLHMSFQLPGGLSPAAERSLWRRGILTWQDFRWHGHRFLSAARSQRLLDAITAAEALLQADHWADYLKCQHPVWLLRLLPVLLPYAHFLDIETTGLSPRDPPVTATIYHQNNFSFFVANINLHCLAQTLATVPLLVTFHGRRFDLPRIRRHCRFKKKIPHLDLAPITRKLGAGSRLKGSLKQLGWQWPETLPQAGAEAPLLWHRYQAGDLQALVTLLTYNAYDAATLEWLWVKLYNLSLRDWPLFRPWPALKIPDPSLAVQHWIESSLATGNHN